MKQNEVEMMAKLMEIARLKNEIIKLAVPEKTYKHIEVISGEIKAMIVEMLSESDKMNKSEVSSNKDSRTNSKLKKVDID